EHALGQLIDRGKLAELPEGVAHEVTARRLEVGAARIRRAIELRDVACLLPERRCLVLRLAAGEGVRGALEVVRTVGCAGATLVIEERLDAKRLREQIDAGIERDEISRYAISDVL